MSSINTISKDVNDSEAVPEAYTEATKRTDMSFSTTDSTTSVSQSTEDSKEIITITSTRVVTDTTTGEVITQDSVSQEFVARDGGDENGDFIADLIAMGWIPRGRGDQTSSTKPTPNTSGQGTKGNQGHQQSPP